MAVRLPISVCMIVRNEAEVLAVALDSVQAWAQQIVVVDTGSEDASMDVARRHGALVHSVPWKDDFSSARNASMDLATAPWILILDADEWFDPSCVDELARRVEGPRDRAFRLPQRNYVDGPHWSGFVAGTMPPVWGLEAMGWVVARQMRLVPNRPDVRYEDPVHETLTRSLERAGVTMLDAEIPIHHVGKLRSAVIMARKKRLYQRLGELKLEVAPSGKALLELGIQCAELAQHREAHDLLRRAVGALEPGADRARGVASLAAEIEELEGGEAAASYLMGELASVSGFADAWERLGIVLMRAGKIARAAEILERAVGSFPDSTNLVRLAADAELRVRQFERAAALYDRLRRLAEGSDLGLAGYALARVGLGDFDPALACLRSGSEFQRGSLQQGLPLVLPDDRLLTAPVELLRRAPRVHLEDLLMQAYGFRSRPRCAHAVRPELTTASSASLEAIVRSARAMDGAHELEVRLHQAAGASRWAERMTTALAEPAAMP